MALTLRILLSVVLLLSFAPSLWAKKKTGGGKPDDFRVYEALARGEDLQSVDAPPVWEFWKSALQAREKLKEDKPQEALDLLQDLLEGRPPAPVDLINKNQGFYRRLYKEALETGLAAAGRLSKPTVAWERKLWALFPDVDDNAVSTPQTEVRLEDKVTRVHILSEKSLFEPISKLLSPGEIAGADVSAPDKCRAFFEWGWALQKLGKKEEALEGYDRAARSPCEGNLLARALYWKGSLEADLKFYDAAEATFKELAKKSDGGRYEDDAYYRLYKLHLAQNDEDQADRALDHLTGLSEGDMKEKYLWEEAYGAYQNQDYEKASGFLEKIIGTRSIGTEAQPQALYWKARIAEIRSKKKKGGGSAGLYRQVLKTYPFSFYALLAQARLGDSASAPSVAKLNETPSDATFAGALGVVDRLNDRKDHAAAADVLDYLTHVSPEAAAENADAVAQRWVESGDFNRALEIAAERLDKSAFDINLDHDNPLTRALYPTAYPEETRREAAANRLPLALILGVMREESLFQREVRSRAGAVGLMQLMPATARIKAKRLGLFFSPGDLKSPSANIRLGSFFLRQMMDRFGDQTPLAVMAYNAGPGNVSKWLAAQGFLPMDEFVEAIPFTETRGYVKRVLRSAHIYGHLLGQHKRGRLVPSLDPPR